MDRFTLAIQAFDRENAQDPNLIDVGGVQRPRELVEAERRSAWVDRLKPDGSEALRHPAPGQHQPPRDVPRTTYPDGRIGYLEWRKALSRMHAEKAGAILEGLGYDAETVERVRAINQKRSIKTDLDAQTMEDALCLAFLEFEIDEFAAKHPDEKIVDILQKTWRKMSDQGHAAALALSYSPGTKALVERALSG